MREDNSLRKIIFVIMQDMNVLFMFFLASVIVTSINGFAKYGSAKTFLRSIPTLPVNPLQISVGVILAGILILVVLNLDTFSGRQLAVKVFFEIAISIYLCYILSFSYTGIILVVVADIMRRLPKDKWRAPVVLVIALYMIINYNLVSRILPIIPLDTFLSYYSTSAVSVVEGIKIVVEALNMGLFLCYVNLLIREQVSEKEHILFLNEELKKANKDLSKANKEIQFANGLLANYAKQAKKQAETKERNRLAREIHDTLGHTLTGIATGLEACLLLMDVAPDSAKAQLENISVVARHGITDVRRSVKALRPDALDKNGLEAAILNTIDEMRSTAGIEINYDCTADLNGFSEDEEDVIYRIVQEGITNAMRHGKASVIDITISRKSQRLSIRMKDNGIGSNKVKKGFGLHHMEERLQMLQGELFYDGSDGFLIEANIPIRTEQRL